MDSSKVSPCKHSDNLGSETITFVVLKLVKNRFFQAPPDLKNAVQSVPENPKFKYACIVSAPRIIPTLREILK